MIPSRFFQTLLGVLFALPAMQSMAACTVTVTSALAFGSYSVFTPTDTTGNGAFAVRNCSAGKTTYTASLNKGSGSFATRTMTSSGNSLQYNLYTSNALTSVWGDGTGSTSTVAGNGTTSPTGGSTITIYGSIPAQQDVPAGSYSDTITITISF